MGGSIELPMFPACWGVEAPQYSWLATLGGACYFRAMRAPSEMASRFPVPLETAKKLGFQGSWFCQCSCKEKVAFAPHYLSEMCLSMKSDLRPGSISDSWIRKGHYQKEKLAKCSDHLETI